MIKVSILIPIYNVEKYLRQCLDSVVNQTLKEIEIICINDGSTDNSLSIINEYASQDERIKVIDKVNTGYGHSMNCGLKIAQGEYIGIVESDDFAELNMFEVLYEKAKANDVDIVKSNFYAQIGNRFLFMENLINEPYEEIFSPKEHCNTIFQRQIAIWSAIYKREHLIKNEITFNETSGASYQDVSFHFKATSSAEKIYHIKEAFLHYRKDNPDSSMKSPNKIYCIFDEFDEIKRYLSTKPDIEKIFASAFEDLKLRQSEFHFTHIDDKFKFEFFERMKNEVKFESSIERIFYDYFETAQRTKLYKQNFFETIKQFKNIFIYGAGQRTIMTLTRIFRWKIPNLKAIVVSEMKNNPKSIAEIPVQTFNETIINKESDVILISIKDDNQPKLLYDLQTKGYRNILLMTKELVTALR